MCDQSQQQVTEVTWSWYHLLFSQLLPEWKKAGEQITSIHHSQYEHGLPPPDQALGCVRACMHVYVCVSTVPLEMLRNAGLDAFQHSWVLFLSPLLTGSECGGIKGVGENPSLSRVPVLWVSGYGGLLRTLHRALGGCLAV